MVFKYKENMKWTVSSILWLLTAIMNMTIFGMYMFISKYNDFYLFLIPMHLFNFVLSLALSIYYYRLDKIDYLRLSNCLLTIHQGLIKKRKEVNLQEVSSIKIEGKKLVLQLRNGKKVKVKYDNISDTDFEIFKKQLIECSHIEKI